MLKQTFGWEFPSSRRMLQMLWNQSNSFILHFLIICVVYFLFTWHNIMLNFFYSKLNKTYTHTHMLKGGSGSVDHLLPQKGAREVNRFEKLCSKASSSFKYFLVQSLGTIFLLTSIFITMFSFKEMMFFQITTLTISLLVKLGSSPFHTWLPSIMENVSWLNCFLTVTFQKLGPIIANNLVITKLTLMIILLNLMVGPLGSLNQNSLCKLMAYSSITHTGWLLLGISEGFNYWAFYFINYTILNMTTMVSFFIMNSSFINQWSGNSMKLSYKIILSFSMLSMGGMPPFIGFLPKWFVLEGIMGTQMNLIMVMLILSSLISLFVYLRISFNYLFFYSTIMKTNIWNTKTSNSIIWIMWTQIILVIILPLVM